MPGCDNSVAVVFVIALNPKPSQNCRRLMPVNASRDFEGFCLLYRSAYNRLASAAVDARQCRWPVRPKVHYFEHLALDFRGGPDLQQCINGRLCANFLCEDFVRRTKSLAVKSHPAYLSKHVIFKYSLQTTLRWR